MESKDIIRKIVEAGESVRWARGKIMAMRLRIHALEIEVMQRIAPQQIEEDGIEYTEEGIERLYRDLSRRPDDMASSLK